MNARNSWFCSRMKYEQSLCQPGSRFWVPGFLLSVNVSFSDVLDCRTGECNESDWLRSCYEINYTDCAGWFFEIKEENVAVPGRCSSSGRALSADRSGAETGEAF